MTLPRLPDKPLYDLILLAFLLALLLGFSLGGRPYSVPSESRYVEIGREMAESGDFVTPRLNYVKYFEKPPLFYWIQAEATKCLGLNPFTARVPTLLFAVLLCLITYGLGRMLYGRLAGWLGALTLATSIYLFALSRIVLLDVPVSVFIAATLTAFLYVTDAPEGHRRTFVIYSMYAAAACAVLTKGLIGALLPGAVVFLWLALTGRWQLLKTLRIPGGTALFLLIAVPWHVLVAERNPEWLHFYFIHEHLERYLTTVHGRYQPDWFFVVVLIAGLFPWIVFAPQAVKSGLCSFWQARHQDDKPLFLVLWMGVILSFFSLSDSKLIPYILPIFPPIAAIVGRYLANAWQEKPAPGFGFGLFAMSILLLLMALAPSLLVQWLDPADKALIALKAGGDELHYLSFASLIMAALLLIVIVQGRTRHVIVSLFIVAAVILELGDQVAGHYNNDSMRDMAPIIASLHKPGDEVISYDAYYQDLPVYLGRRITVVYWKGELEFGTQHENTSAWMIEGHEFWRRWLKGGHRIFMVMRKEGYPELLQNRKPEMLHIYPLSEDDRNILLMNEMPKRNEGIKP